MQLKQSYGTLIKRIAGKEITLSFASPIAYLFLAAFAGVTLFVFFWVEDFFSRNISDVRPMFEAMPILLIFLASAITMRLWSEERRTGTLEYVLTQPVPLWVFVIGKFVGCLVLLVIAIAITLPLPLTVSILGELDWGPVWAGYLATFLLGAAYLSIGLFISALCRNQIVSLICSVAVCGLFYLIGSTTVTELVGNRGGEILRLLGTGARFDAITRGVIDLRDLYYYVSIIAVFLVLNTYALEQGRWAAHQQTPQHGLWRTVTALLLANAIGANLWLGQLGGLRIDATQGNQYSISTATQSYLNQLREPLLLRGYFSSKTHPLLAPLVPQLRDLMREYEIAGHGRVRVEFVDPMTNPELEEEANQKYGIQPVPFQVADRYQSSIVSSYFNVLVDYGDQHQVLGFRDLIEVKSRGEGDLDVQLRNPEHDLTRAIKTVLNDYQAGGNLFDTVQGQLTFNTYVSADAELPKQLVDFKSTVKTVLDDMQKTAGDRLQTNFVDPTANGGAVAQQIQQDFGFRPMATNLFSGDRFYFYMTLAKGDQTVQVPLDEMTKESFKRNLEAGIKRFASGFTKTVALVTPKPASYSPYGGGGPQFSQLESFLGNGLSVQHEDLSDGSVSGQADILLLVAPKELDEKQLFAVDQFLMKGGTVIAATSPYSASVTNRSLTLQPYKSGLADWLKHYGLTVDEQLVMDPQNAAFPVPVTREVGGFRLQEIRMVDYPYFIDVRGAGLNSSNPITADIPQAALAWASPITVDTEKNADRQITELFRSSNKAWLSSDLDVMPRVNSQGLQSFRPQGDRASQLLGVIASGRFDSYFAGKSSPLLASADADKAADNSAAKDGVADDEKKPQTTVSGVIERSPESARIILFSSNDFLRDDIVGVMGSAAGSQYTNTVQLVANSIDWSLEDAGLLSISGRGHFNRTLPPMAHTAQLFWEYANYAFVAIILLLFALVQRQRGKSRQRFYLQTFAH